MPANVWKLVLPLALCRWCWLNDKYAANKQMSAFTHRPVERRHRDFQNTTGSVQVPEEIMRVGDFLKSVGALKYGSKREQSQKRVVSPRRDRASFEPSGERS
jgi:hypothetical protein